MISVFDRVGNIVGKGENAGYHSVSKSFFSRDVKSRDCVVKGKPSLKHQILDSSKLKEFAENNIKF